MLFAIKIYIYINGILALVCNCITHIAKKDFLLAFNAVYNKAFTENNTRIGFRGTKLVLLNLDIVILKFTIQLYILILLIQQYTT